MKTWNGVWYAASARCPRCDEKTRFGKLAERVKCKACGHEFDPRRKVATT